MPTLAILSLLPPDGGVPVVAPSPILGGIRRYQTKLHITPEGHILIDQKTVMVNLDGQVFVDLNGVYMSQDGHLLLNLNMNKPVYMIIN